jgi:hypothetical protein
MDKAGIGDTGQDEVLFQTEGARMSSGGFDHDDGIDHEAFARKYNLGEREEKTKARAQAFASLVALAERSSALSVNLGQCSPDSGRGAGRFGVGAWCCTIEFNSGDLLDAVADSPEAAVKAVEAKMKEREDIQSGLMEDT